ncbi:MAG: signal peptidase I [Tissierellia bacterium]|nr:signal peptidase I [Tissierellia bacterium]
MEKENKEKEGLMGWVQTILVALVLAFLIRSFIFNTTLVIGESMEPTLHERDRLICLIFPFYFSDPDYGDIVIIDAPNGSGEEYVKRVVGRPGDRIDIDQGRVYRNGVLLEEDYIHQFVETETYYGDQWELGEGEFFVMGDNRHPQKSIDSRAFGPVHKDHINSRAFLRYYPFSKIAKL